MSVSKYVDWMELWSEEVCFDESCLDYCFHLDFDFIIQDVTYEQG